MTSLSGTRATPRASRIWVCAGGGHFATRGGLRVSVPTVVDELRASHWENPWSLLNGFFRPPSPYLWSQSPVGKGLRVGLGSPKCPDKSGKVRPCGQAFTRPSKASRGPPVGRHGDLLATNGSANAKPNTRHQVTAARAGRSSGRTVSKQILRESLHKSPRSLRGLKGRRLICNLPRAGARCYSEGQRRRF